MMGFSIPEKKEPWNFDKDYTGSVDLHGRY